jgi:hypothetical protein
MNRRIMAMIAIVLMLALCLGLLAAHRDEFPGRRQGGGSQSLMEK